MAPLSSILVFAVAAGRLAVLGAVSREGEELPRLAALTQALMAQGAAVATHAELEAALLRGGRQRARAASPDAEAMLLNVARSFDVGDYPDTLRRAQAGEALLSGEPPSARREALRRQLETLWGGAWVQLGRRSEALVHFERALVQDPEMGIDRGRFPPPVQETFERARAVIVRRTRVTFEVNGPVGARLFVDGIARAVLPVAAVVIPHPAATVWLEWDGQASLARDVNLEATPVVGLNWGLESALRESSADLALLLPAEAGARKELCALVVALASVEGLVLLERGPDALRVWRVDGAGDVRRVVRARASAGEDWASVVHELFEEPPAPPFPPPLAPVEPVASAVAPPSAFPWLTAGLIAGGALVVVGGVVLAASVHGSNAVLLGPTPASP